MDAQDDIKMQSDSVAKLAEALSKAQGALHAALKDGRNPHFKSSYATLASVIDAAREPLSENGLAISQTTLMYLGQLSLVTTLMHTSGEFIKGLYPLISSRQDPQSMGSALTYARRYCYSAIIGLSQADDDAEGAVERPTGQTASAQQATQQQFFDPHNQAHLKILGQACDQLGLDKDWKKTYGQALVEKLRGVNIFEVPQKVKEIAGDSER